MAAAERALASNIGGHNDDCGYIARTRFASAIAQAHLGRIKRAREAMARGDATLQPLAAGHEARVCWPQKLACELLKQEAKAALAAIEQID